MGNLQRNLDQLARRGSQYLRRFAFKEAMEKAWGIVGLIALLFPLIYAGFQVYELATNTNVWPLGIFQSIGLAILIPLTFLAIWALIGFLFGGINRQTSLALFDRELRLKDRLQAADEFINKGTISAFETAAVEDAVPHAEKALQTKLGKIEIARPAMQSLNWRDAVTALVLLAVGVAAHALVFEPKEPDPDDLVNQITMIAEDEAELQLPTYGEDTAQTPEVPDRENPPAQEHPQVNLKKSEDTLSSDSVVTETQEATSVPTESMQSGLSGQSSKENQPGQAASSISGMGDPDKKPEQEDGGKKSGKRQDAKKKESKKNDKDDTASGLAGGKGTGSGHQSASSEMLEQNFRSDTADTDDDVDQESDDEEDEEQEAANAGKPMLNQKKAPVDRRLSPSGIGTEENENNNGRGGAGGRKKTRGVAAMLLGVPMPDKLRSQVNVGRIKVQRERAVPVPNQVSDVESESRGQVDATVGTFARPVMKPWSKDVVKKYFTTLRQNNNNK